MEKKFNDEEMAFLASVEKQMRTATEARWISHIPRPSIERMLSIWERVTGSKRPFNLGCGNCVLRLVIDMGTLYFQQKAETAAVKPQETAKSAPEAPKVSKTTAKAKTPSRPKNSEQK